MRSAMSLECVANVTIINLDGSFNKGKETYWPKHFIQDFENVFLSNDSLLHIPNYIMYRFMDQSCHR
jgi:hypothetical protein